MNYILSKLFHFVLVLSSDAPSLPDGDSFLEKIIPNIWAFLVQFLALVVLIIIFFIVGYKPVRNIIRKRQEHIENQINEAENINQESKQKLSEADATLLMSKKEALKIIDDAKEDALRQKDKIIKQANEEVSEIKDKAQKDIARDKERAKDEIKRTIIDVALDASKQVLSREINEADNEKLVDEFIEQLQEEK